MPSEEDGVPDNSWTNDQIRSYLDDHGIAYKAADTKAQLLDYLA
ncbi:Ish1 domain-containing protein [Levilactobacillus namurensis]